MKLTVHTCLVVCFVLLANALRQSTMFSHAGPSFVSLG